MKVASTNNPSKSKPDPILPLIGDEDEVRKEDLLTFTCRAVPANANSTTYKMPVRILDGTESLRTIITWRRNCDTIFTNVPVADAADRYGVVQSVCKDAVLVDFCVGVEEECARQQIVAATQAYQNAVGANNAAPTDAERQAAYDAQMARAHLDFINTDAIEKGFQRVLTTLAPVKALQKVKRYMRRECRKPLGMKIREYFNRLVRINNQELIYLPPFNANQKLSNEELIDVICYAVPKSWIKEMDRQGIDPDSKTLIEVVNLFERIEASEDNVEDKFTKVQKGKGGKTNKSSGKKSGEGQFYCLLHGANSSHNTDDCHKMKADAKRLKTDEGKKGGKTFSNKQWKRQADDGKNQSKNELNKLVKKAVRKEMNNAEKKRKSDDSDQEVNALEEHLFQMDLDAIKVPRKKEKKDNKIRPDEDGDYDLDDFSIDDEIST